MSFPIDISGYKPVSFALDETTPSADKMAQLAQNVQIMRDTLIFFTAIAAGKGLAGHTGGPYSIVPEALIADGFMRGNKSVYPVHFDEAGHRVALQYVLSAFHGEMPMEKLLHYREANHGLYGHPERDEELGVKFASGRLGHMWPYVNGVARANPDMQLFLFGSDGSQQEGNDAEAARLSVANKFNVKVLVDDNNVTIAGHPREYLPGFDVERTLAGHGLATEAGDGEDLASSYARIQKALNTPGPVGVINRRVMAPGVDGIEGKHAGHDVIPVDKAITYLEKRGYQEAIDYLKKVEKPKSMITYVGSTKEVAGNRAEFGKTVASILQERDPAERKKNVFVIDSDLEGSTGIKAIHDACPDVYVMGGVMERGNLSAAAGFGFEKGRQGVFSTFSAFMEMVVSEISMARLNESNLLCHFSHAGVDEIADNTCHYGINLFYGDSSPAEISKDTRLYFPADAHQLRSLVPTIFDDPGIRFVFTNRSKVPFILTEDGKEFFAPENGYRFVRDKDEVIREGRAGYVVSYGEMLYRSLDAVDRLRKEGVDVGLINKPTLNVVDEDSLTRMAETPFVLTVEAQNRHTGLGIRMGTWFLERELTPRYAHMGTTKAGAGGLAEHVFHQGMGPEDIKRKILSLHE
ncbi:MAG: transketolase C-terminal domain-containing protein [Candidatus Hydrogenedentota bacterium]